MAPGMTKASAGAVKTAARYQGQLHRFMAPKNVPTVGGRERRKPTVWTWCPSLPFDFDDVRLSRGLDLRGRSGMDWGPARIWRIEDQAGQIQGKRGEISLLQLTVHHHPSQSKSSPQPFPIFPLYFPSTPVLPAQQAGLPGGLQG